MTGIALVQGCYFFLTGIWPLLHIESFQKVTGRKTDLWLVKTVGVLVLVIGLGLIIAGIRQHFAPELILLAMASALGLIAIDLFYAFKRIISLVYVLDALVEVGFLVWWIASLIGTG
ncbi:MAG: hypothetical protein M1376_13350 [Planctomycetes bacterium]|nr:hypothetical protein [Planctomycetota bacterium]